MKFSSREDIEVPADFLFGQLTDFPAFERSAVRRGAELRRISASAGKSSGKPGGASAGGPSAGGAVSGMRVGDGWDVTFRWRGRPRRMALTLAEIAEPDLLVLTGQNDSFEITVKGTVIALSPRRSRLVGELEVRPRAFKARVLLQSARLGKGALDRRYADGLRNFAHEVERRYARSPSA